MGESQRLTRRPPLHGGQGGTQICSLLQLSTQGCPVLGASTHPVLKQIWHGAQLPITITKHVKWSGYEGERFLLVHISVSSHLLLVGSNDAEYLVYVWGQGWEQEQGCPARGDQEAERKKD